MYHLMIQIIPKWKCNYLKMANIQKLAICGLELNGFIPNDNVETMAIATSEASRK